MNIELFKDYFIVLCIHFITKEIGIRKVNGARFKDIVVLLNKGFLIWFSVVSCHNLSSVDCIVFEPRVSHIQLPDIRSLPMF